jgi:hypothetical protein
MENKIIKLLEDLNISALDYNSYEYGLPTDEPSEMRKMCSMVADFISDIKEEEKGNIGKVITDFYCNGKFGRRYDLAGAIIEAEGKDWILIRIKDVVDVAHFTDAEEKNEYVYNWTYEPDDIN